MSGGDALLALGGAFLAAGLLARFGSRIGLLTIPLFMVAGMLGGPHTPGLALFDDPAELRVLSALGLVFLLFYLGVEFSVDELAAGGRTLALAGGGYLVLNVCGGLAFGLALGWGVPEALVLAGVLGISSSAIVTKLLVELRRMVNPETRLILGIIVVEDVFLALYLALLQPILGGSAGGVQAALDIAKAFGFLLALAAIARYGSRLVAWLVGSRDDELLIVCFTGLAVLVAGIAEKVGVSDAIGAFMVGLILGSSPLKKRIQHLVHPLRDAFGALFFFAFGVAIEPGDLTSVAGWVLAAVALSILLNIVAGVLAGRLGGYDRQASANIGLTVLARGEFALILAALATTAGLDRRLAPFVAGYVLILAILGPLLTIRSHLLAQLLARLPPPRRRTDPAQVGTPTAAVASSDSDPPRPPSGGPHAPAPSKDPPSAST